MHDFQPIEPGVDHCAVIGPNSGLECGMPAANGRHTQIAKAPEDEHSRRRRAIDTSNKVDAAFAALVKDEDSPMCRVFCEVAAAGDRGVTDNELYVNPHLEGMPQSTIRPRRIDLVTAGLVERALTETNDHARRETGTGGTAQVWVLTPIARVLLARLDTTRRNVA